MLCIFLALRCGAKSVWHHLRKKPCTTRLDIFILSLQIEVNQEAFGSPLCLVRKETALRCPSSSAYFRLRLTIFLGNSFSAPDMRWYEPCPQRCATEIPSAPPSTRPEGGSKSRGLLTSWPTFILTVMLGRIQQIFLGQIGTGIVLDNVEVLR